MKIFFGTDGIRGIANQDLTPELVFRVGRTTAGVLAKEPTDKILVGKDPRISSDMLENALVAGILSTGTTAVTCGIIPTPAVSFLTRTLGFVAGMMISASHNPIEHNGIKIFGLDGLKLSDEKEKQIEQHLKAESDNFPRPTGSNLGKLEHLPNAVESYVTFLKSKSLNSLSGIRLVLDCAHGATCATAPMLFRSLGATVIAVCDIPDGHKINVNCGATNLALLQAEVVKQSADLGIAFDGDGDRAMFVTSKGDIFNGDHTLAALAFHWKEQKKLREPVVTTVMANFGLEEALQKRSIPVVRTRVGDRYVIEEMIKLNSNLGGEQSGHIILIDDSMAGDGCLTALHILRILVESGKPLSDLRNLITEFPQILLNVSVERKSEFQQDQEIQKAIRDEEIKLHGRGRIVVRPSGTEPLVRVMAEGPNQEELERAVGRVAQAIKKRLK